MVRRGRISSAIGALAALAVLMLPAVSSAAVDSIIYDGDSTAGALLGAGCPEYAAQAAGTGVGGGNALQLKPDAWHNPAYNLYCGGQSRRDLTPYDVLEFKMRAATSDAGSPTFYVRTWNFLGKEVKVTDYIEGGKLDTTWRLVRIPIPALATAEWKLGNVERLVWGKDASNRTWYIDDIAARDIYGPSITGAAGVSDTILRVGVSEAFDLKSARTPANYVITSATDPAYQGGKPSLAAGVQIRFKDFGPGNEAVNDHMVYVRAPSPLKSGHTYTVAVKGISDTVGNPSAPTNLSFTWDDMAQTNPVIKVNQVGYLPDRPKLGYVAGYLGDFGGAVWAVGDGGAIAQWDKDTGWKAITSPTTKRLNAVAATSETLAYAVGDDGTMLRWSGAGWVDAGAATTSHLYAVTFGPSRIAWAVGAGGTALRLVNGAWTKTPTPTTKTLRGVWAGADDAAWAVGDGGTILRWTGSQWSTYASPTTADLLAVNGPHEESLWAVGANGTVLAWQWGNWTTWTGRPSSSATLRSIAWDPMGGVWVTGDGGLLWKRPQFGTNPFVAQTSPSTAVMRSIARLDERRILAVGAQGAGMGSESGSWKSEAVSGATMNGVTALPYGALRLPDIAPSVTLFDADSGVTSFTVPLELRAANWGLSGEDVYQFDFSTFTTPGTYRAYVPGIGVSDPFRIGVDVLDSVAYATGRSFYYQRCGAALTAPYIDPGYERGLCHSPSQDAAYDVSLPNTPLYNGEKVGAKIDAAGGWHDAGDFGKYMPTGVAAVWYLLEGYELDTSKFVDGAWNIPESGNGVPDILDEARFEIDWMLKIERSDGAFPHKVTAACWFNGMPEDEAVQRYIYESTTYDTATGAAVLASAARVYQQYDAAQAAKYLAGAKKAWTFLQAHPNPTPAGGAVNPPGNCTGEYTESDDIDNRMWAAAELYRATGEQTYRAAFETMWAANGSQWGWNDWQHHYKRAYWAYLRTTYPTTASTANAIRSSLISQADTIVNYTLANPYMNGSRLDVPEWIGWGVFTMGPKASFPLLQAYVLTGNESYRDMAVVNADAQLGVNPLSLSFITGVGARYPHNPLDMESEYDGVDAPVPGLPLFGVHHNQSKGNGFQAATQDDANNYPWTWTTLDPLPVLRRFNDAFELPMMTEFTVLEQALTTVTFHLLSESTAPMPPASQACGGANACDDGNPCTTDSCDPAKGCMHADNSAPCNDGDACTVADTCYAGACSGNPLSCDDANPCTTDSCNGKTGCDFVANTAQCNDGDPCTTGDACAGGVCGGKSLGCDDGNPCTADSCDGKGACTHTAKAGGCDDGDPCTTGDACAGGVCGGKALACDDGNLCTTDSCDAKGGCAYLANTAGCDDGNPCTAGDACAGGSCGGKAVSCDDGDLCTVDACGPTGCLHMADPACAPGCTSDAQCDDGDACTVDSCGAAGECAHAASPACAPEPKCASDAECDDGNPCTTSWCIPDWGCRTRAIKGHCDDGNACTYKDLCWAGQCTGRKVKCGRGKTCEPEVGVCK